MQGGQGCGDPPDELEWSMTNYGLGFVAKARFVAGKRDRECVQPCVRLRPRAAGAADLVRMLGENADVAEPVDATDLKSVEGDLVRVRVPPSAPIRSMTCMNCA